MNLAPRQIAKFTSKKDNKTYTFEYKDVSRQTQGKVVITELPYSDTPIIQYFGLSKISYPMKLDFNIGTDENYYNNADNFLKSICTNPYGKLSHPRYGNLDVIATNITQTDSDDNLASSKIDITFVAISTKIDELKASLSESKSNANKLQNRQSGDGQSIDGLLNTTLMDADVSRLNSAQLGQLNDKASVSLLQRFKMTIGRITKTMYKITSTISKITSPFSQAMIIIKAQIDKASNLITSLADVPHMFSNIMNSIINDSDDRVSTLTWLVNQYDDIDTHQTSQIDDSLSDSIIYTISDIDLFLIATAPIMITIFNQQVKYIIASQGNIIKQDVLISLIHQSQTLFQATIQSIPPNINIDSIIQMYIDTNSVLQVAISNTMTKLTVISNKDYYIMDFILRYYNVNDIDRFIIDNDLDDCFIIHKGQSVVFYI